MLFSFNNLGIDSLVKSRGVIFYFFFDPSLRNFVLVVDCGLKSRFFVPVPSDYEFGSYISYVSFVVFGFFRYFLLDSFLYFYPYFKFFYFLFRFNVYLMRVVFCSFNFSFFSFSSEFSFFDSFFFNFFGCNRFFFRRFDFLYYRFFFFGYFYDFFFFYLKFFFFFFNYFIFNYLFLFSIFFAFFFFVFFRYLGFLLLFFFSSLLVFYFIRFRVFLLDFLYTFFEDFFNGFFNYFVFVFFFFRLLVLYLRRSFKSSVFRFFFVSKFNFFFFFIKFLCFIKIRMCKYIFGRKSSSRFFFSFLHLFSKRSFSPGFFRFLFFRIRDFDSSLFLNEFSIFSCLRDWKTKVSCFLWFYPYLKGSNLVVYFDRMRNFSLFLRKRLFLPFYRESLFWYGKFTRGFRFVFSRVFILFYFGFRLLFYFFLFDFLSSGFCRFFLFFYKFRYFFFFFKRFIRVLRVFVFHFRFIFSYRFVSQSFLLSFLNFFLSKGFGSFNLPFGKFLSIFSSLWSFRTLLDRRYFYSFSRFFKMSLFRIDMLFKFFGFVLQLVYVYVFYLQFYYFYYLVFSSFFINCFYDKIFFLFYRLSSSFFFNSIDFFTVYTQFVNPFWFFNNQILASYFGNFYGRNNLLRGRFKYLFSKFRFEFKRAKLVGQFGDLFRFRAGKFNLFAYRYNKVNVKKLSFFDDKLVYKKLKNRSFWLFFQLNLLKRRRFLVRYVPNRIRFFKYCTWLYRRQLFNTFKRDNFGSQRFGRHLYTYFDRYAPDHIKRWHNYGDYYVKGNEFLGEDINSCLGFYL